jgi:protein-L-isoaspartate(D-aspartate) O-methyltransferase
MQQKRSNTRPLWLPMAALLLVFGVSPPCTDLTSRKTARPVTSSPDEYREARERMVREQIEARAVRDARVLAAMRKVPRHLFVPPDQQAYAYIDSPQPIGYGQTISQPYIVAFMTEQLDPQPTDRILEIGTGSGYQAAVLAVLVKHVYSIEIVEPLATRAAETFKRLQVTNVTVRAGDGYQGWREEAPFDAVIVTCAPNHIPKALVEQLKEGGKMIIPVGDLPSQELYLLEKRGQEVRQRAVLPVRFVPMTRPLGTEKKP